MKPRPGRREVGRIEVNPRGPAVANFPLRPRPRHRSSEKAKAQSVTDTTRPPLRPGSYRFTRPESTKPKHVIAEYEHAQQTVTCTCGWHGSSATPDGRTSDWSRHVAENRPGGRR